MITVPDAHELDVNVASWSTQQPASLVTGADDGCIRVWDLRMVHQRYGGAGNSKIAAFTHSFDVSFLSLYIRFCSAFIHGQGVGECRMQLARV